MTAPARLRRRELRERRQAAHRAAQAAGTGRDPKARVMAEVDHVRRVIAGLPSEEAERVADQAVRALAAITATHQVGRRRKGGSR